MGNFYYGSSSSLPSHLSYQQCKDLAAHLNTIIKQNEVLLKIGLSLDIKQMKYTFAYWKQSSIPGKVYIVEQENQLQKQYNIQLLFRHVYMIYHNMKHFEKEMQEQKSHIPSTVTPENSVECCICLDKSPTMMLPCSHEYCAKCTQIYIIDVQQKKCPKCRRQFKCGRQIIQEDGLYEDLRKIILDILSQLNERQVNKIRKNLKSQSFLPQ